MNGLNWRNLLGAGAVVAVGTASAVAMMPIDPVVRLETELHGLDIDILSTAIAGVALTRLENRSDKVAFCSVGFYHGFDLRERTHATLSPGSRRLFTYPVRQRVSAVPIEVVCGEQRAALPRQVL